MSAPPGRVCGPKERTGRAQRQFLPAPGMCLRVNSWRGKTHYPPVLAPCLPGAEYTRTAGQTASPADAICPGQPPRARPGRKEGVEPEQRHPAPRGETRRHCAVRLLCCPRSRVPKAAAKASTADMRPSPAAQRSRQHLHQHPKPQRERVHPPLKTRHFTKPLWRPRDV